MSRLKKNAGLDNNLINEIEILLVNAADEALQAKYIKTNPASFDLYDLLDEVDIDTFRKQVADIVKKIKDAVDNMESQE